MLLKFSSIAFNGHITVANGVRIVPVQLLHANLFSHCRTHQNTFVVPLLGSVKPFILST